MIKNDRVYGVPLVQYKDTKTNIEALSGIGEGAIAYATDTNEFGSYDGTTWTWGQSGSTAPATTAANDFQVGDGSGNWVKKTLAQTVTILRAALDSVYAAISHTHTVSEISDYSILIPFGVYTAIGPFSTTSYPYMVTIDRSFTFASWAQAFYVATTNDASNYWTIRLFQVGGTTIKTISTATSAANAWTRVVSTSFDLSSVTTSDMIIGVEVAKFGSPGALSLPGPALEVTL